MVRNLVLFLVIVGFVFSAGPVIANVDSCQNITEAGVYTLNDSLIGICPFEEYCIQIISGDVVLDCDGYTITGKGEGIGISLEVSGAPNITVKNCIVSNYDTALLGDPMNSSVLDNEFYNCKDSGLNLFTLYSNIENNLAYNNGQSGFRMMFSDSNTFTGNTAYNNNGSGFDLNGNLNTLTGNTAYGNDWEEFEGAGFESFGFYNVFNRNTAYNNTNGFYIEGPIPGLDAQVRRRGYGNTFTNNEAHDNIVGLNFLDFNGTYTGNTLEENTQADMLVGGDIWLTGRLRPPVFGSNSLRTSMGGGNLYVICFNTVERNTGSGGRPIYYTNESVRLIGGPDYSEVILCNAVDSTISGVTVDGSDTLNNNGMTLLFSNGTTIRDSTSKNNFMGFGFVYTPNATLSNSDASGSGFGIFALRSIYLDVDGLTSSNNRMDSTVILNIIMDFLGTDTLTGEGETLRSDAPPFPEMGAGALLVESPRATITDSTFSGSTFGLALIMSDEAIITGGTANNNDVFGYGLLDSYNVQFDGPHAYENAGDVYDIFGEREIPPEYEMLELFPLGIGVLDVSFGIMEMFEPPPIEPPPIDSRGGTLGVIDEEIPCNVYRDCISAWGDTGGPICNFDTYFCEAGTFENVYSDMRIYGNHYGLGLLNIGHEVVEECRVYDNHILGVLDVSDPLPLFPVVRYTQAQVNRDTITLQNSYFYRNGEELGPTFSKLYEEGDRPQWAEAFELFDIFPKGVLELEIIEASYLYQMELPLGLDSGAGHWELDETTVGTGRSSVRMSIEDNANALYIISDTTFPTLNSITIDNEDLGVDMTVYLDIDNAFVEPRVSYNDKYFLIAAINNVSGVLEEDVGPPAIDTFVVHYGNSHLWNLSTMGLYFLNIYEFGQYCEVDADCPDAVRDVSGAACWENMCVEVKCRTDTDCNVFHGDALRVDPTTPYCVGYQCVQCRDDSNCAGEGDCARCLPNGNCKPNSICIADIDCLDGCECNMDDYRCEAPITQSADGSCGSSAPIDEYVVLRTIGADGDDIIMKARWIPVKDQINNVPEQTITVYNLTQNDQSEFLEMLLGEGVLEEDASEGGIYFSFYGLFAVEEPMQPGGDGGDDGGQDYVCMEDIDCKECEFCSRDNNMCRPRTDINVECGVPETECPTGYECKACECVKEAAPPEDECKTDRDCSGNEYCDDGECVPVECPCGEVKDHACVAHPCCSNEDCDAGLLCKDNKCVEKTDGECNECDEPIKKTEDVLDKAKDKGLDTSKVEKLLDDAKAAKARGDCEDAVIYAEAALAAAEDLLEGDVVFPAPVISTEVPSVDQPQLPNGTDVTQWQQDISWFILIILGIALVVYWYFRNHYGK